MPKQPSLTPYQAWADRFRGRFDGLRRFLRTHGGRYPSRVSDDPEERTLAVWVTAARGSRHGTGPLVLTPARRQALETIPGWRWAGPGTPFHVEQRLIYQRTMVETVEAAVRHFRTTRFARGARLPDGRDPLVARRLLRTWHAAGTLPPDLAKRLRALPGWTWQLTTIVRALSFDEWLGVLDRYVAREGHACVPVLHDEGRHHLGRWVSRVRTYRRRGRIPDRQARQLERRKGWQWSLHPDRFRQP